jgi:oligoendopeptidase F
MFDSQETFLKFLKTEDELKLIQFKIFNYLSNNLSIDINSTKFNGMIQEFQFEINILTKQLGSYDNLIIKNRKNILK